LFTGGAAFTGADRVSPDQACLELAVMLQESLGFPLRAATEAHCASIDYDRRAALSVLAIGANKAV
jgi:hypothetical protein